MKRRKRKKEKKNSLENMLHELSVASIDPFLFLVYG
jgi:hypothetical protein